MAGNVSKKSNRINVKNLVMAGGVAANSGLRESIENLCKEKNISFQVPPIKIQVSSFRTR